MSKSGLLGLAFRLITEVYVDVPNNTVMFIFVYNTLFPCYCL